MDLDYYDVEWFALETDWAHSVVFEIALKYCISDFFVVVVDYESYSISFKGFLLTVVIVTVIWIKFPHSHSGFPGGTSGKEPTCQCRRHKRCWVQSMGWEDPRVGKIPWRRACNPLQYSCLDNPLERGAYQSTVQRVAKSWTWLKRLSMLAHMHSHFSSWIPKMSVFTLANSCLTTSSLPWFMDLAFQTPSQHCSL